MKRNIFALICIFFVTMDSFGLPMGNPRITVKEPVYNFGTVAEGSTVSHEFVIENVGDANLIIKQVINSCGCTVADVEKKVIAPNESTKLKMFFKTNGFSGEKYKTVRVYTNDVGVSEMVLALKGNIVSDINITPSRLSFGTQWYKNIKDKKAYLDVTVESKNKNVKILDVFNSSKYLDVKILEKSSDRLQVRVFLKEEIALGEFRDRVVINLSGSNKKAIDIPVFARILGDVSLTPSAVYFGVFDSGVKERVVRLNNLSDTLLKVEKISTSESSLKAKVVETEKGKSFDLILNVDSEDIKDDLKATVKVYTDNPNYEVLTLGVYGIASK